MRFLRHYYVMGHSAQTRDPKYTVRPSCLDLARSKSESKWRLLRMNLAEIWVSRNSDALEQGAAPRTLLKWRIKRNPICYGSNFNLCHTRWLCTFEYVLVTFKFIFFSCQYIYLLPRITFKDVTFCALFSCIEEQ